jgi:hypothetical protein
MVVTNCYNLNEILLGLYRQKVLYYYVMRNEKNKKRKRSFYELKR